MSAMLMIGECGMSEPFSSASAFSTDRAANHSVMRSRMTGTCFGRSEAAANRGPRGGAGRLAALRLEGAPGAPGVLQAGALGSDPLPSVERRRELEDAEGRFV